MHACTVIDMNLEGMRLFTTDCTEQVHNATRDAIQQCILWRSESRKFCLPLLVNAHVPDLLMACDATVQIVSVAQTFVEVWEGVASLIADLDVLAGFADLAAQCGKTYSRPTVTPADSGEISLQACRHPCVEAQDGVDFISNDCVLKKGQSWFQIITGPNMGGKSTYIRQVRFAICN